MNMKSCKIYPEELSRKYLDNPKLKAEVAFYNALAEKLPAGFTVFYDIAWLAPVHGDCPQDGQTDFLIAHPEKGILLVEVKGGTINYDAQKRKWTTTGRDGTFEIDPIAQVRNSKHALKRKLQSVPAIKDKRINIFHAVAFPDAPVPSGITLPDAPNDILIDYYDMQFLSEKIESIFQHYDKSDGAWQDGASILKELFGILGRSYEFRMPLARQCAEECEEIIRLTEEQFDLLDNLNRNNRVAVRGCAGSGKTFLAVEKARRLAEEGYRTLLTCFNRPLADHLKSTAPEHQL